MRPLVFLACAAVTTGCGLLPGARFTPPDPGAAAPPPAMRQALQARWPGARVASDRACPQGGAARAALTGDFNGDGQLDMAVQLQDAQGRAHLAVVFTRTSDYTVAELTKNLPARPFEVQMQPRGARFVRPETGLPDNFGTDTLLVAPCGQSPTGFFWTGTDFNAAPNLLIGAAAPAASATSR